MAEDLSACYAEAERLVLEGGKVRKKINKTRVKLFLFIKIIVLIFFSS